MNITIYLDNNVASWLILSFIVNIIGAVVLWMIAKYDLFKPSPKQNSNE